MSHLQMRKRCLAQRSPWVVDWYESENGETVWSYFIVGKLPVDFVATFGKPYMVQSTLVEIHRLKYSCACRMSCTNCMAFWSWVRITAVTLVRVSSHRISYLLVISHIIHIYVPNNYVPNTLWLFNIAMENGPFIDGLPIVLMMIFHGYVK